jgi:Mitochondrial ribosomal protein L37
MTVFRNSIGIGKRYVSTIMERNHQQATCLNLCRPNTIRCYTESVKLEAKAGTPIQGIDVFNDKDIPVVLERDQYPEWVFKLPVPLLTFAQLRRMPKEDATLTDMHRFLRLRRRLKIKSSNERTKSG